MSGSDQGTAYSRLVAVELDAQLRRRAAVMERMSRTQQSASLPISLVAAVVAINRKDTAAAGAVAVLTMGIILLVVAVLIAIIGERRNRSLLARPRGLERFVTDRWQDDERDARFHVAMHQLKQAQDLTQTVKSLYKWSDTALRIHVTGLVVVVFGLHLVTK